MNNKWKLQAVIVLSLTLVASLLAPTAEAADHQLRAVIEEPFMVAGRTHAPTVVTVRDVGAFTPDSMFAEVWVGNECLGRLIARDERGGSVSTDDALVFSRRADGSLELVGVSFRGEPVRMLTGFGQRVEVSPARLASEQGAGSDDPAALASLH